MAVEDLKQEILSMINETNEEEILNLVREELAEYKLRAVGQDATDELREADRAELERLVQEDPLKDTITLQELQSKVNEWRSK